MDRGWLQKSLDHNRENQNSLWQRSLDLGARATGWVLAANAGALVLCFNAIVGGHLCDWTSVRLLGLVFTLGMATAYLSVLCEQRSFEAFSLPLANFIAKGTAALGLLEQLKQIEQLPDDKLSQEVQQFYRETKATFDQAADEVYAMEIAPKSAVQWMRRSNWTLAASCGALCIGIVSALWLLSPSAICSSP